MSEAASTSIQREAPFLEDYRRRLMDSVFAATDKAIVPQEREIAPYDAFQQAGFSEAARQLGFSYDPATGGLTQTGSAMYTPFISAGLAGMQQGQQTAAQGIPALQQAQQQYDPSQSNYQQFLSLIHI